MASESHVVLGDWRSAVIAPLRQLNVKIIEVLACSAWVDKRINEGVLQWFIHV